MEEVFKELGSIKITAFVKGIRDEIGEKSLDSEGNRFTEKYVHAIWYVWSPIGTGKTNDEKTREYYGERAYCTRCSEFTWDASVSVFCDNIASQCYNCVRDKEGVIFNRL